MMSGVQGGNFWNGFASGALSSISASAWSGGTNHDGLGASGKQMTHYGGYEGIGNFLGAEGVGGMIAFGSIAGGAGASMTGGNFWQGAVTGLVVSGLNHAMDHGDGPRPKPRSRIKKIYDRFLHNSRKIGIKMQDDYKKASPLLRKTFDQAEILGGSMEIGGLLSALFTEGAGMAVATEGAKISLIGTGGNVAMDIIDGEYKSAFTRTGEFLASAGAGKAFEAKIPQKAWQNISNAFYTFTDTFILPVMKDSWNKFNTQK